MERRSTPRWKLGLLVVCTVAAGALLALAIARALDHTQTTSSKAAGAAATSCYETDSLLWHIDRASYAGYRRDTQAAAFLYNVATRSSHGGAVVASLAENFAQAAQDAYWQPLVNCGQVVQRPDSVRLQVAVPIGSVPQVTIGQTLAHPPAPPR